VHLRQVPDSGVGAVRLLLLLLLLLLMLMMMMLLCRG